MIIDFQYAPAFAIGILGLVVCWLIMVAAMFRRLKKRHMATYQDLGEPSYRKRGSDWRFTKFICLRGHSRLHDPALSLLGDAMLVCFMLIALGILAALLGYAGQPARVAL